MSEVKHTEPHLDFIYLTFPEHAVPLLNINAHGVHARFQITREQLFCLNEQIADILVRRRLRNNEQLVLGLEKAKSG